MNKDLIPLQWADIRESFAELNRELTDIIDDLNPSPSLRLYKARYSFGNEYVQLGKLFLPNGHGGLIALNDARVPNSVKEDLSYNLGSNPVSFIMSKSAEIYMPLPHRSAPVPYALVPAGHLFSTSVILQEGSQQHHPAFLWNISAGARSIFMLPKISKTKNYRRLQSKLGYNAIAPNNIHQHWSLFKDMYKNNLLGEWNLEVIFFSKAWFEKLDTPAFAKFKSYMQKSFIRGNSFWTNQHIWNTYFSLVNNAAGIRPNPYAYDISKHLFMLGMGILPGIAPAYDNNAAPIAAIQDIFANCYKLDKYLPIVMQLKRFNLYGESNPVYYSLNYSNATELSPRSTDYASTILELYEVKNLMNLYLRNIASDEMNISNTVINDVPRLVNFNYYHSDPKQYRDIQSTESLFNSDSQFSKTLLQEDSQTAITDKEHPNISTFVRGCVQISHKDQKAE